MTMTELKYLGIFNGQFRGIWSLFVVSLSPHNPLQKTLQTALSTMSDDERIISTDPTKKKFLNIFSGGSGSSTPRQSKKDEWEHLRPSKRKIQNDGMMWVREKTSEGQKIRYPRKKDGGGNDSTEGDSGSGSGSSS
ncbi:hypothetical protein DL771_008174 [Monosporascus sp. 5C6A]|nr:hypothetical protein DL771_008174 [Monosporascus sp. 5C6A]